jgi:hypothetical protein
MDKILLKVRYVHYRMGVEMINRKKMTYLCLYNLDNQAIRNAHLGLSKVSCNK